VQGQKLEHIDSARSCPSLQGLSLGVVSTPYCRAAKLTLVHLLWRFTRASFLLPFLLTRRGPDPHKGGGSRLNISAIGGNFVRIRSPILVHPGWSCWVNCDLVRSYRVKVSLVEKSSKTAVEFNFYRRIRLSTASAISSGGFLTKPPLEIILQFVKKTIYRNPWFLVDRH
jgi:hypothetical protein